MCRGGRGAGRGVKWSKWPSCGAQGSWSLETRSGAGARRHLYSRDPGPGYPGFENMLALSSCAVTLIIISTLALALCWRVFGRMSAAAPPAATAAADVLSNPHLLAAILEQLARASDLAHATAVSTAWCQEGCANALWRAHCLRSFPQLAGLLVAGADFRRLFIGQARSLHRPFRAPTPPELSPHGLRFLVHIEVRVT